jgi:hypothetical protein
VIRVEVQTENSGIRESDFEKPGQDRSPVSRDVALDGYLFKANLRPNYFRVGFAALCSLSGPCQAASAEILCHGENVRP